MLEASTDGAQYPRLARAARAALAALSPVRPTPETLADAAGLNFEVASKRRRARWLNKLEGPGTPSRQEHTDVRARHCTCRRGTTPGQL